MRRRSVLKTATFAPMLLNPSKIFAQDFDLIIRSGRVIDPSLNLDTVADVGILNGRIANIAPSIVSDGADEINAVNKIVIPGLLDICLLYTSPSPRD